MPVAWSLDLTVHIDEIDRQHQELFRRVELLLEAMRRGEGADALGPTLAYLSTYVVEHFNAEEEQMVVSVYPGYEDHKAKHTAFINDLDETAKRLSAMKRIPASEVLKLQQFLTQWIRDHVNDTDKELGRHLIASAH